VSETLAHRSAAFSQAAKSGFCRYNRTSGTHPDPQNRLSLSSFFRLCGPSASGSTPCCLHRCAESSPPSPPPLRQASCLPSPQPLPRRLLSLFVPTSDDVPPQNLRNPIAAPTRSRLVNPSLRLQHPSQAARSESARAARIPPIDQLL
jgi:hypothetical protein